jgi:hypothetical protein
VTALGVLEVEGLMENTNASASEGQPSEAGLFDPTSQYPIMPL